MIKRLEALQKFLKAVSRLAKNKDITIEEAYKFAKQEFGEVSDLLKLQINKIFKTSDAPSIKKPKSKNNVFTLIPKDKLRPAKMEETPSQASGLESLKNPFRPGGGLDPTTGMTRTAARVVLDRYGIKVPDRGDAIDVFEENFGGDALMDLKDVADELIEKEQMGRITESMGEFLESRGMFDLKVDKTARKGMSNKELLEKMEEVEQEDILKKFDPEDREPNSKGGINRARFARGKIKLVQFLAGKGLDLVKEVRKSVDDIFETGDTKYDADVVVDDMVERLGIDRDTVDQRDLLDAYDQAYKMLVSDKRKNPFADTGADKLEKALGDEGLAPKMKERFELKEKYPGLDDDILTAIIDDPDPNNKAQVLATLEQLEQLRKLGKTPEEAVDIISKTMFRGRKDNAEGGLNYLMGM